MLDVEEDSKSYRWADANAVLTDADADVLTAAQVRQWRERGYVLVDGVFDSDLIERARSELTEAFPEP
jgi:hypothetical protein